MHASTSVRKIAPSLSGWSPTATQHKRLPCEHVSYSPPGAALAQMQSCGKRAPPSRVCGAGTRYMEAGIKGLYKDKGKGKRAGKKPISEEIRLKIITKTVQ